MLLIAVAAARGCLGSLAILYKCFGTVQIASHRKMPLPEGETRSSEAAVLRYTQEVKEVPAATANQNRRVTQFLRGGACLWTVKNPSGRICPSIHAQ